MFRSPQRVMTMIAGGVVLGLLVGLFLLAGRGFDVTDESSYLLRALYPHDIALQWNWYGTYTGVLFAATGEDLGAFRRAGIVILALCCAAFARLTEIEARRLSLVSADPHVSIGFQVAAGLGVLAYYRSWMLTPSYNWLAFVGCLIAAGAMLHILSSCGARKPSTVAATMLLGLGTFLAICAKWTSGIVLIGMIVVILMPAGREARKAVGWSFGGVTACVLAHMILVDGGPVASFDKLLAGMTAVHELGSKHTLQDSVINLERTAMGAVRAVLKLTPITLGLVVFWALWDRVAPMPEGVQRRVFALSAGTAVAEMLLFGSRSFFSHSSIFYAATTVIGVLSVASLALSLRSSPVVAEDSLRPRDRYAVLRLLALLVLLPLAFAAGTNSALSIKLMHGFLPIALGLVILAAWAERFLAQRMAVGSAAFCCALLGMWMSYGATTHPYRLTASVHEQLVPVETFDGKILLRVDAASAAYVSGLQAIARTEGWRAGERVIDLTGGTPGALIVLTGRFVGTPWLLGGYPNSSGFTVSSLSRSDEPTRSCAWILRLAETGGQSRRVPDAVLTEIGLIFPADYDNAGSVEFPYRQERHQLWRPRSCERSRMTGQS